MRKHYLERVFSPSSVAVIYSDEHTALADRVLQNLKLQRYEGEVYEVCALRGEKAGKGSYLSVAEIASPVKLAVIAARAEQVPEILHDCGQSQVEAVIVLSSGFAEKDQPGSVQQAELVRIARSYGMALIGPDGMGIIRPSARFNASTTSSPVAGGKVALITQSGAFCSALLDWAGTNGLGFSAVASLGATSDVKLGHMLDYFAQDPKTTSILLYVERVTNARLFMGGLRAAARLKPVVIIKTARNASGQRAALSQIYSHLGDDRVFHAAIRRAGAVRVTIVNQMFAAIRILSSGIRSNGLRLGVITNGGGPGVMAADWAGSIGVPMAQLKEETVQALSEVLPAHWSHSDPVDILGDADAERYQQATEIVLRDPNVDGLLVLLTPQGVTDPTACAQGVIEGSKGSRKPVLASWMGAQLVAEGRSMFAAAGIPNFRGPETAVDAFGYLAAHRRNQNALLQVPEPLSEHRDPDIPLAQQIIAEALAEEQRHLSDAQARGVLHAFRVPVSAGAGTETTSVGREIKVGIHSDPVFGPVIHLGAGGVAAPIILRREVALPPLNDYLSRELIKGASPSSSLGRFLSLHSYQIDKLVEILQRVSEIACELPAISQLDIDLLALEEFGVVAVGVKATIQTAPIPTGRYSHLAIAPYPADLETRFVLRDSTEVLLRPIRPEDAKILAYFVEKMSPESKYFRFMHGLNKLTPAMLARFTQIDYDREIALIAQQSHDEDSVLGAVRYVINPDVSSCEFALAIADEWQAHGMGRKLMERLMDIAKNRGLETMEGEVLAQNSKMLRLCKNLGFGVSRSMDDPEIVIVSRPL